MNRIAVVGASGFIGRHIQRIAESQGLKVTPIRAPRLHSQATNLEQLLNDAHQALNGVRQQISSAEGADTIINAAGLGRPTSSDERELKGANALLPTTLALALSDLSVQRLVHLSSAAVYGRQALIEGTPELPETPYAVSKLLGDRGALASTAPGRECVIYRPTSVHGEDRQLTQSLIRFAKSHLRSVAGPGDRHTPQVLVENVARTSLFLATTASIPDRPVIHPSEGLTVSQLLSGLSGGKAPHKIPSSVARVLLRLLTPASLLHPVVRANTRRLQMLWFGQEQRDGWLASMNVPSERTWDDFFSRLKEGR